MYRPGGYPPQYRHGSPGTPIQPYPVRGPIPPPIMHGRGPPTGPTAFPGGHHQQNLGFGPPPAMPLHASHAPHGFSTIPSLPNQGAPSSATVSGMPGSMPPLEQQYFPGPPTHGQPPRYPVPPPPNFTGALPPGPPVDILPPPLPPRPTFSPLLQLQPSSGFQSQTLPPSHTVTQHMPHPPFPAGEVSRPTPPIHTLPENLSQPPQPPAFSVCQPSPSSHTQPFYMPELTPPPSVSEHSQPPQISANVSEPLPSSHPMPLLPPPQRPDDDEIVQNIEILSEFVVKNGPEFENMARARQAGNPKFSFLFNGMPGSDSAIGYQYFQWMKMKWELQMKMGQETEDQGQFTKQFEQPLYTQQGTAQRFEPQAVSTSPAVSDMDMEDDFAITATSTKDGKDLYSYHAEGMSNSTEHENKNASSNLILKATDDGKKEETMPINVAHMDFSQSDPQGKQEISHLTFERKHGEEMIPVQSTGVAFQQIVKRATNNHDRALHDEGFQNSSFSEDQRAGSIVTPERLNLTRNHQEMMPEDLAHRHVGLICAGSRTTQIMGVARSGGDNIEVDKIEHSEREACVHSHAGYGLGEASQYLQDHYQTFSWNNDATKGRDQIIDGEVPKKEVEERIGSIVNQGTSDSESDEVLYTAKRLKRGERSRRSQSPGDIRLRSCSRSPKRHRSRTRSPRRGDGTKDCEETEGICLNFARGICFEGSSCKFFHHKASANSIVDYSDEDSEEGKGLKEMEQDLKVSVGGIESSAAAADNGNNISPGKQPDGHDNPIAREVKSQETAKSDDSSGKGKKSPEWDLDFASEPYSAYFDREIFQPSVLGREGLESQSLRRDDFRPLPLRREDFEPQTLSREASPLSQRELLQPQPSQREDLRPQFLRGEDFRSHLLEREEGAHLLNIKERRPSVLLQGDMQELHKQRFLWEDIRAQPFIRDDLRARPLFCEEVRARPLFRDDVNLLRERVRAESLAREDPRALPLFREDVRSQPLLRRVARGQPLLRDDLRVPSLLRNDLARVNLFRKDVHLDPFPRGSLRFRDEDLQRHSLLREEIRFQHLVRENSRLNAEGLRPREDLHPRLLSREDAHLKALARDLPSHHLDVSTGKFDPLLLRNPSIRQNIALPVNTSWSSHSNRMRSPDPLLMGPTTSSSVFNHPREASFLREQRALLSEVPFSMNANSLSQPDTIPPLPHNLPRHSPQNTSTSNIYGSRVQHPQTYRYAHAGGPSVPGPAAMHGSNAILSTAGGPYDPLYDSIDPTFRSKILDFRRGEHIGVTGAVRESDMGRRFEDVNPENEDGNTKDSLLQPEIFVENNKGNLKAYHAVEVAIDAEVGVVDNESPRLRGGRDGSPGHHLEVATTGAGEIDMDQTHANEKTRNIKEMKVMKVFRTALADFAKELLKPTWREGQLSKEAFKTIVKKAVDKVAGTLQSHQIPNTQERIDHYLESSRAKFTKLVEGYVEKYIKV